MKQFIAAGFCEPLDPQIARACQPLAHGIRTGLAVNDEHSTIAVLVEDTLRYFSEAVFVIGGWDWREDGKLVQHRDANLERDPGPKHLANQCESLIAEWLHNGGDDSKLWVEIGNELDGSFWKDHLAGFHRLAMACYDRVRAVSTEVQFVTGSTMNFNREFSWQRGGYEVLDDLCGFRWPVDTIQGLHPYRDFGRNWSSFDSDAQALAALTKVLRGRRVAITEMGWSSASGYGDARIAEWTREEIAMWRGFGAACYAHYQVQDESLPYRNAESGFGAFSNVADGLEEKQVARVLREAIA